MKVALVSREYPPHRAKGGIGTQTYGKAHGLAARGHDVWVISESIDGETREEMDGAVHVIRIGSVHARIEIYSEAVDWLSYSTEVAQHVQLLHQSTRLDLVDFPEWGGEGYCFLLNRPEWDKTPRTVVHIHGPLAMFAEEYGWPETGSDFYRIGCEMEGTSLRLADGVISSSRYSADRCAKRYQLGFEIPILHTGVDTNVFRPLEIGRDERPTILFAGKISASKGVVTLLEACSKLLPHFPTLRLRMLGRGEPRIIQELEARASAHPDLLDLPGFVPHADLPAEFAKADVFAAPSPCEGGPGFVYLEAMACGLPVIACSGTGAAEVVGAQTGVLVPPQNVDRAADAIYRLLKDETLRRGLAKQARCFVESEMNSTRCLDRIEEYYARIAGVTRTPL